MSYARRIRLYPALNQYLLKVLDNSEFVTFNLIAAFRWRDGYPVHFEFESTSVEGRSRQANDAIPAQQP